MPATTNSKTKRHSLLASVDAAAPTHAAAADTSPRVNALAFKFMLRKNLRLLARKRKQICQEIAIMVYMFAILLLFKWMSGSPMITIGGQLDTSLTSAQLGGACDFDDDEQPRGFCSTLGKYVCGKSPACDAGTKNRILLAPCAADHAASWGTGGNAGPVDKLVARLNILFPNLTSSVPNSRLEWACAKDKAAVDYEAKNPGNKLLAAAIFDAVPIPATTNDLVQYTLYTLSEMFPDIAVGSKNISYTQGKPLNQTGAIWVDSGLVALQHALQVGVTDLASDGQQRKYDDQRISTVHFRQEPFLTYEKCSGLCVGDSLLNEIGPQYMMTILVLSAVSWLTQVVEEKEKQLRDRLLVSGLSLNTIMLTSFVTFVMKGMSYVIVATIMCAILIPKSNLFLVFLFLVFLTIAMASLMMAMSSCFKTAKMAAAFGTLGMIVSTTALQSVGSGISGAAKTALFSLFPPCAGLFAFQDLFWANGEGNTGVNFANAMNPVGNVVPGAPGEASTFTEGVSVGAAILICILDTFLYAGLTVYFNAVIKGNGARAKSCCWCLTRTKKVLQVNETSTSSSTTTTADMQSADIERPDMTGNRVGISIQNLCKEFTAPDGATIRAVNGLSLDMYDGQVTALLGHNGAGKTTTMSLLTGILDTTSGDAEIYGLSLSRNLDRIRTMVGFCVFCVFHVSFTNGVSHISPSLSLSVCFSLSLSLS